jgi:hypothetical protein
MKGLSDYLLCVGVPPNVARQGLCKHVPAALNVHATIELLDEGFSVQSMSYRVLSM